jgi:hypothetical protein
MACCERGLFAPDGVELMVERMEDRVRVNQASSK